MHPTKELVDQLHREDLDQAKGMSPAQKLWAGGDLFDSACQWTLAGIRAQNPGISDEDALRELRRRLATRREPEKRA